MNCKEKCKEIFSYLLNVKNLNDKIIRSIWDYEKIYWENELLKSTGCSINKSNNKEWWLKISKKCKRLYDQFSKLYLELESDKEIVWGHGLIVWKFNEEKIVHPILTTNMKLSFDTKREVITLVPSDKTLMEMSIFEGIDIPNFKSIVQIQNKINNINLDPRSIKDTEKILKEVAAYLSTDGRIEKEDISVDKVSLLDYPIIYNTPVILIRKKNMRPWQREIANIIDKIDKGYPIPQTIKAMVEDVKTEQSSCESEEWKAVGENLLFPLSSNYEQKEIVKRISENCGVVVQGAPGTGKSHLMANLICHLIANGKRILVTSEKDKALKVLKEKIPTQIKPLCLSVLEDNNNFGAELNESVKKIVDNMSIDSESLYKEINTLQEKLELCRKNQNSLYINFKEAQRRENDDIIFDGEKYKITEVAKWVKENENQYSWIKDKANLEQSMPLTEQEFENLISLFNEISKDDKENLEAIKAMIDKIPTSSQICRTVYRFKELNNNYQNNLKFIDGWRVPDNNRCNYDNLLGLLEKSKSQIEELDRGMFGTILESYYSSDAIRESFNDIAHKCNDYMLMLSKIKRELRGHKVDIPLNLEFSRFKKDFNVIYENLRAKGRIGKIFKIIHPEFNFIIKECKVDGRPLETLEQALIIKLHIQENFILKELKMLWNNIIKEYGGCLINSQDKEIELMFIKEYIKKLNNIVEWDNNNKSEIIRMLGRISVPKGIDWHNKDTYNYLIKCLQCIKNIDEYDTLKAEIEILKKLISATGRLNELNEAIEAFDISMIRVALNKVENFNMIRNKILELDRLLTKLRRVCPITTEKLINRWGECKYNSKDWMNAWKWARWNTLLKDIYSLNISLIEKTMEEEKRREKVLIEQIIAKKAWYNQILRTSGYEKTSLFSWMQAIKKIGKGNGKMASKYRSIAQQEMEKCKGIIPVWIMPLNRVIENVALSENLFDVVIFDESSQSDIFSICVLMRAKKAIIVGDDKEGMPESLGVDQGLIQKLISKHLRHIPHSEWFDFQTSLYQTALRVFPNRLMLKEHFRCLPEIIGFSNKLIYSNEIKVLRYPNCYEKSYPAIVPIRVNKGHRERRKLINIPEAESLVNTLAQCCKDKRYLGMTMGVISLLGEAQSELIEKMIREKIGEEEIVKRKITCGDAYSLQGDERDIIFLSMVISKNEKVNLPNKEGDIRKFNVATSRAKSQMWLFYSIDLKDLNPDSIRYSLLKYCLNNENINSSRKKIEFAFNSKFKKDIYELIKSKGYFVLSEVKLGQYKMDFVVEGGRSRVAIICDENANIEKETFNENIERQMDLQQLGWIFYRIRASEFYYRPEKTMERLWKLLDKDDIESCKNKKLVTQNLKVV